MVNGLKLYSAARNICSQGKIVYSAKTQGASAGTMFDAFCKTMSGKSAARQSAKNIVADTTSMAEKLEKIAAEILKDSKANAEISCRVKSVKSTAPKIQKKFAEMKDYESSRDKIHTMILGNGTKEIVGDSYGIRFILNSEATAGKQNSLRIYDSILSANKKNPKEFSITGFEDYYGQNIKPYGNSSTRNKFAKLDYKTTLGEVKQTIASFTPKPSGYTRTNINAQINGVNTEIQVGGLHTTKWGDVEHILYDIRQKKPLDMSKYTPEQKKLAREVKQAYTEVLQRQTGHTSDEFSEKYLNKLWNTFRDAEVKNLKKPVFPSFPQGYPDVLNIENLLKLAHD